MMIVTVADQVHFSSEKMQKVGLVETDRLFLDLYCLGPGQAQRVHIHPDSDKVYYVLRGRARVTEGGAAALLRRLARVYLGPEVDFPPMPDPPAGFVIRMAVEKVSGNGRWSDE